jgi:hypothetical protein
MAADPNPRFEYTSVPSLGRKPVDKLNELGAEGWQVVAGDSVQIILMREMRNRPTS